MPRGLIDRFASSGLDARAAVADTWGAAHAAARYAGANMAIVVPGGAEPALAHLPLASLRLDDALLMDLRVLGMATVGDAADQPRAPLLLRFGPQPACRSDPAVKTRLSQPTNWKAAMTHRNDETSCT